MNYIKIRELDQLKKDYDIFTLEKNSFSKEMIEAGHYPPLLINQDYLLWGFPILKAANRWNIKELHTRFFDQKKPEKIMEGILICENRTSRFSWREIRNIVTLTQGVMNKDLEKRIFGNDNPINMENFDFFNKAQIEIQELIDQKALDFKMARLLQEIPEKARKSITTHGIFQKFSFSQKRIFIQYFYECLQRDKLTPPLAHEKAQNLLNAENPIKDLHFWRFPQLSQTETQFQNFVDNYLKKSGIQLKAPPYFEGRQFSVEFPFSTAKNLKKRIQVLKSIEEHASELFELL